MRYLITQSLLSAWNYLFTCREESKEEAYADFLRTLRREKGETTEEMQNGIDFENAVYERVKGVTPATTHPDWENGIQRVATALKGAQTQVKQSRALSLPGFDFLVYGIFDGLRAGTIYDVKFLNKSFTTPYLPGKYLNSPQHACYLYLLPEASEFVYLVSDGTDFYTETYTRSNTPNFVSVVAEFIKCLIAMGLLDEYETHWQAL